MKRYLYVYNPYSGAQAGGHDLDQVLAIFYKHNIHVIPHRLFTMEEDTVLDELLAAKDLFDGIIILGGDGTVGQIIDKLIRYDNHAPVGIIPGGTCNDFARNLKLPNAIFECINTFCEGKTDAVDLLQITAGDTTQYICNSIAAGVFVGVSHTTSPEFKKVFGSLAYYISALGQLNEIKSFRIRVETDTETIETDALLFAVLNGTDVGGMKDVITEADLKDGEMNLLIVKDCPAVERAGAAINLLARKGDKNVIRLTCPCCRISVDKAMAVSVDGESGLPLPYEIRVIPRGLNVLVPAKF